MGKPSANVTMRLRFRHPQQAMHCHSELPPLVTTYARARHSESKHLERRVFTSPFTQRICQLIAFLLVVDARGVGALIPIPLDFVGYPGSRCLRLLRLRLLMWNKWRCSCNPNWKATTEGSARAKRCRDRASKQHPGTEPLVLAQPENPHTARSRETPRAPHAQP